MSISFDTSTELWIEPEPPRRAELSRISWSRTHPPTMSARPCAARTAEAIALARSRPSVSLLVMARFSTESLDEAIAESWRERVEPDESARHRVRVDLWNRMLDGARHRVGDFICRLSESERPLDLGPGLA